MSVKKIRLLLLVLPIVSVPAPSLAAASVEPYPLEYFALREVVSNVTVSPDAKRVAMLKIIGRDGDPILHVYDADDLDGDPFVVDSDPMEIRNYQWVSDNHILMILRQKVRDKIEGQNQGVYEFRITILDIEDEKFDTFDKMPLPQVEHLLPNEPDKIIVSMQPGLEDDLGTREAFRPRAYYKIDLERGTRELLIRGKIAVSQIGFDADGDPRSARGFDASSKEFVFYYREKGGKGWDDIYRIHEDEFEGWMLQTYGFDDAKPGNVLVKAFNGDDKLGLWSYNTKTREFDELIYRRSDVDVYGVRYHSNTWTHGDRVVAVSYFKDKFHFQYFDEVEEGAYKQLEQLIPHAHYVTIPSRSRDGNSLVARNIGPRDPGTYYLLHNGQFKVVGSHQPLLESEKLADVEYKEYKARDGMDMAMFVTVPNGEPPFPTVVMPHGGPHVHEIVLYDEWAQVLANNGYMVVQPQYRMSMGYGYQHFISGLNGRSESGRKMQDDMDDAALHLVKEGLADEDRLAMYGWSYGGYAALIAASREPQIYQCAIAGAAPTDYRRFANNFRNPSGADKYWTEVWAYDAVHPVDVAQNVNVPLLLLHGSVDQRVQPRQARMYLAQLKKHNVDHKFVELEGADHFYDTLFYHHQLTLYENLIGFLQNECGPGGL